MIVQRASLYLSPIFLTDNILHFYGIFGLACWDSWGRKESIMTEQLNWTELILILNFFPSIEFILVILHICSIDTNALSSLTEEIYFFHLKTYEFIFSTLLYVWI